MSRPMNEPPGNGYYETGERFWWWPSAVVPTIVALVVVLLAAFIVLAHRQPTAPQGTSLDPQVAGAVTTIAPAAFDAVGTGGVRDPLIALPSGSMLTSNGKPEIFYVGAEYCPFCAAERWSMVLALSRFGTWYNLGATSSSDSDVYPDTATFTFHGATYTSPYIVFDGKEIQDRYGQNLETLSSDERTIFAKYDAPPYTSPQDAGGIPFISFGNQYMTLSSGYSPALLHDGQDPNGTPLTAQQIASTLINPRNPVTKAIVGNANYLTAAICKLTNDQPSSICASQVIHQIEAQLPAPVRGR